MTKEAQGLAAAHAEGVLHRDLKPSNILIDEHDQPHVTDFGLAKLMNGESELTITGAVLGSPSYLPPEQAARRLGCLLPLLLLRRTSLLHLDQHHRPGADVGGTAQGLRKRRTHTLGAQRRRHQARRDRCRILSRDGLRSRTLPARYGARLPRALGRAGSG